MGGLDRSLDGGGGSSQVASVLPRGEAGGRRDRGSATRQASPGLQLQTHHGYFTDQENTRVLGEIAQYDPQVLLVGMGMPRQENWVLGNLSGIRSPAILTIGACFDYIVGEIPTPPRWMGRAGLEWLYRLASEPTRLWRRYLVEPWSLIPFAARDIAERVYRRPA